MQVCACVHSSVCFSLRVHLECVSLAAAAAAAAGETETLRDDVAIRDYCDDVGEKEDDHDERGVQERRGGVEDDALSASLARRC